MPATLRRDDVLPRLLWCSGPIALLVLLASVAGVASESTYAQETASWAAQARGQDVVNVLVALALPVLAWRAARGTIAAWMAWVGLLVYLVYSYTLYAMFVHFGPWFPVYVAILGVSGAALVGGLAVVEPLRVRSAFGARTPIRVVGRALVVIGVVFATTWVGEIVSALRTGTAPASAVEAGLVVNPVHVLDLAFVLPAMVVTGVALRRGRSLGHLLVVPLLVFGTVMGLGILAMFTAMASAGLTVAVAPVVLMAVVTVAEAGLLGATLGGLRRGMRLDDLRRDPAQAAAVVTVHVSGPVSSR